jgi:L-2-hydroxyglutarate oxidase LhgO
MEKIETDITIIGGGILGLAIARAFAMETSLETVLVEKNKFLIEETSSRNSGVLHAGFIYPLDSLKTKFCNEGRNLLYDYAKSNNITHKKIGKIIIGNSSADLKKFKIYKENAKISSGTQLVELNQTELKNLEPNVVAKHGLLSPETGLIDVHELASSFEKDIKNNSGVVSLQSLITSIEQEDKKFILNVESQAYKYKVSTRYLILAGGLHTEHLIRKSSLSLNTKLRPIRYAKGHYFKLIGEAPFKHLIYPIPGQFGLGIHSTTDFQGSIKFGPDVVITDQLNYSFEIGREAIFRNAISNYWPDIQYREIHEDYVGVRPKIQMDNEGFCDYQILTSKDHNFSNFVCLHGIESPGLTSCMAIANYILESFKVLK